MKLKHLAYIIIAITFATLSCTSPQKDDVRKRVLVLHTYDQNHKAYHAFDSIINATLEDRGVNPDIRNLYCNVDFALTETAKEANKMISDSIDLWATKAGGCWTPDIVIVEGDAVYWAIHHYTPKHSDFKAPLDTIPFIYGGLHFPNYDDIENDTLCAAFTDHIDFAANISLASEMYNSRMVNIEMDNFDNDSILRPQLINAINHPPFVDNSDFNIPSIRDSILVRKYAESIIVNVLSAYQPWTNMNSEETQRDRGYEITNNIYSFAWQFPSLQVKCDIYSNFFVSKSNRPQFTCLADQFADGRALFLAGYFASYNTIATDVANCAADFFHGESIGRLKVNKHVKAYYMDYDAMKKMNMIYSAYKDKFIIVNAPDSISVPLTYRIKGFLIWSVIILLIFIVIYSIMHMRQKRNERLALRLNDEHDFATFSVEGAGGEVITRNRRILDIADSIVPEQQHIADSIRSKVNEIGTHHFEFLNDKGWSYLCFVTYDNPFTKSGEKLSVQGFIINISHLRKRIADLDNAIKVSEEAKTQENFMSTIYHEMRTPMNAIQGFSDIIANMDSNISSEEFAEIKGYILQNNISLTKILDDTLLYSNIQQKAIKANMSEIDLAKATQELLNSLAIKEAANHRFIIYDGRPNTKILGDKNLIYEISKQFISNAVKFSPDGTEIYIGWRYDLDTEEVELFVEDCGCGIQENKVEHLWNILYKSNGFVPGLGLGLAISKSLAELMGMRVTVDTRENIGSRFSLWAKRV